MFVSASPIEPIRKLADSAPALDRMADLFIRNKRNGYDTDLADLRAEDFSEHEILTLPAKARKLADKALADRDTRDDAVTYDRPRRIEKLSTLLLGLFDKDGDAWALARRSGFSTRELTDLWPDARHRIGEIIETIGREAH
ncbi:hypothetical protein [Devosia sp. 2618]|uniref:hypothetical protein n=1 Tax=Devosia sp. 2618 TaxID=3156454 RepID=UPI003392BFB5